MPTGKGFRIFVEIPDTPGVSLNYEGAMTFERLWAEFEFAKKLNGASAIRIVCLGEDEERTIMHEWKPKKFVPDFAEREHQSRIIQILGGRRD
jgi:hypothetical protein